jgi:glycosyltransferase involved in cell wall biosynthesis
VRTFHIVTPCLNAERWIAETVQSVLDQTAIASGRAQLRYVVVDGGSTDRTLEILRSFSSPALCVVSEPDGGMYDALAKALQGTTGATCAYLNAGDLYGRGAFEAVLDLVDRFGVRWLTGMEVAYNEQSQIIHFHLPYRYRARLFACGAYGRMLPFVQQESTFWDASLHAHVDFDRLRRFKYAGDYYLWHTFARFARLQIVQAHLGGFRVHRGQQSAEHRTDYVAEMRSICRRPAPADYCVALADKLVWSAPVRLKKALNRSGLYRYDSRLQSWT